MKKLIIVENLTNPDDKIVVRFEEGEFLIELQKELDKRKKKP